jgi:hypothetical protein
MSLYDVKDRADRVDKWLKEDDDLIGSLYTAVDRALHENPEAYSPQEHESNIRKMKDIVRRYATLGEHFAEIEERVKKLADMCPALRKIADTGYIEVIGVD